MKISFDPAKRELTLRARGLDFGDAEGVFAGPTFTFEDARFDYPEIRSVTVGLLAGRMVVLVWTPDSNTADDEGRRIISMRKANAREQARYLQRLEQAGRNHR
jgi:uncharacterized DUF497 family protein